MPKLQVDAQELTNVQVSHVSLVKRGAIRIPFRILKSEGDVSMINLTHLFKRDPMVPTVAAVIVNKASDLEVAKARLTKANFQIEKFDDTQEGVIIFPQSDSIEDIIPGKDGAYIVKMDEMLSCVITGVAKAFEPINFDSASFDEVLSQEGMRPGIHLSMDVLGATVSNILAKAEDREEMVTDLSKALDEFKSHIVAMASAVPESAFSIDFFKGEAVKTVAKDEDEPVKAKEDEPVVPVSDPPKEAEPVKAKEGEAPVGDPPKENEPIAAVADMGPVMKQMADLAKGINAVGVLVKDTAAKVDAQSKRIDETAVLAKSANDKISRTILGVPDTDPVPVNAQVSKADFDKANPPLIDTAYSSLN